MKNLLLNFAIATMLIANNAKAQTENPQAIKALKKSIGSVLDHYITYSYPTNNFGVGTSCLRKWRPKGPVVCDMIHDFGLDLQPENTFLWKSVNGFAYYGQGGSLKLNDSVSKTYGVGVLLKNILNLLSIDVSVGANKIKSVEVSIDSAVLRDLNYGEYKKFVMSGKKPELLDAWNQKRLLVVTSDFVLLDYSLTINPTDSFGLAVNAKLDSLTKSIPNLSSSDTAGVKISKTGTGSFTLKSSKPVVFAVYIKKQRNTQELSDEGFKGWDETTVEAEQISPSVYRQ